MPFKKKLQIKGTEPANQEYTYFTVYIQTGDRPKAGTDANVYLILHAENGEKSSVTKLDVFFRNDFERGQKDKFKIKKQKFKAVEWLELWRDKAGAYSDWFIDTILVVNETLQTETLFPVLRWIRANYHYHLIHIDTSLPQHDHRREQRRAELVEKRELYQLEAKFPGLPAQVRDLPDDEEFSFDYMWDIAKHKHKLLVASKLTKLTSGKWESIDDIKKIYGDSLPPPNDFNRWFDDLAFGRQRIAGVNNTCIQLCRSIPEKLGVTDEMVNTRLEGMSLQKALDDRRIFVVDHEMLRGCPTSDGASICAPIALFYQRQDGQLIPIAIQLNQEKGPDNPVFLPTDPHYTWIMAKMWFNVADAAVHEAVTHLTYTHLLMEGCAVITHRHLSISHPVFKLLAPHYLYLIAINSHANKKLVAKGEVLDKIMAIGATGVRHLMVNQKDAWRMDVEGTFPESLKDRGVAYPDILPGYHFRDDALLLYMAIKTYVTDYARLYYTTDDDVSEDTELQCWRKELVKPIKDGGCGLSGVPGDGKFTRIDQVITAAISIIFTCSVSHAGANFKQYDEYCFPPNFPTKLNGEPPRDKSILAEKDIVAALPDKSTTFEIMVIMRVLGEMGTKPLGDFELQYIFDPKALKVLNAFRDELKRISGTILERNKTRNPNYTYLLPSEIPNGISI